MPMRNISEARVPFLSQNDLPEDKRYLFDRLAQESGRPLDLYRVLAHCPDILHQFMRLGSSLRYKTKLNPKLRELAILTVSAINGATWEYLHHLRRARGAGIDENQLVSITVPDGNPAFNDQERAVIRYATEVTRDVQVSDATFEDVNSFLDKVQLVELTMLIAYYNMSTRFLRAMEIPVETEAAELIWKGVNQTTPPSKNQP
jgi:AhpD family alkylhydroperoxidase